MDEESVYGSCIFSQTDFLAHSLSVVIDGDHSNHILMASIAAVRVWLKDQPPDLRAAYDDRVQRGALLRLRFVNQNADGADGADATPAWTPRERSRVLRFLNSARGWKRFLGPRFRVVDADTDVVVDASADAPVAVTIERQWGRLIDRDTGARLGTGLNYCIHHHVTADGHCDPHCRKVPSPSCIVLREEFWRAAPAVARARAQRDYQRYVVNHEFGHAIGLMTHASRSAVDRRGRPACMAQQTLGTAAPRGCHGFPKRDLDGRLFVRELPEILAWLQCFDRSQ